MKISNIYWVILLYICVLFCVACSTHGREERSIQNFGGETQGKETKGPLGRSRRRWEDNAKMELQEVGLKSIE